MNRQKAIFIVVSWNNEDLLQECFETIKAQTYTNHRTILVDNGSADQSIETARKAMPEVEIYEAGKNLGFAAGNNRGIEKALEDEEVGFIVLLNSDARLHKDWLAQIIDFAHQKPKAACLQGTTLDYYNHSIIDSTHIYVSRLGQGVQAGHRELYTSEFGPKKVFGVNAAACVITRNFIEAQPFGRDVFDETMFMYLEDVDLAARATVMGWDNFLVPTARAYHMGSASSGKNPGFSLYMTFRNNLGLNIKNLPPKLLLKVLANMWRADRSSIKHLKLNGKGAAARHIRRGRVAGLPLIPIFLYKRYRLRAYRNVDDAYLWQLMKRGF